MAQAGTAFSRSNAIDDTALGWRFVNQRMKQPYGVDAMPETAENVTTDFKTEREAQDRMALASQLKAVAAQQAGHLALEITPVTIAAKKKGMTTGNRARMVFVSGEGRGDGTIRG